MHQRGSCQLLLCNHHITSLQVKVGIEYDKEIFGSYLDNTSGGDMDLGEFMSLEAFVEGE